MINYKEVLIKKVIEYDGQIDDIKANKIVATLNGKEATKSRLLTTRQAAEFLDMHPVTLRALGLSGVLNPIRYSARKLRWPEDMLSEYLYNGPGGVA